MLHLNHPCHKSNNTFIDNAEDLDIVVPMYSLLKYSDNYSLISGCLQKYYRDEKNDDANKNINNRINYKKKKKKKKIEIKNFENKTKLIGSTANDNNIIIIIIILDIS